MTKKDLPYRAWPILATLILFAAILLFGSTSFAEDRRLTIAGAADLSFAMKEIAAGFEKETGAKVTLSMGSTGMLAAQIRNGAPFDLFFAADRLYVEKLKDEGFIVPDSVENYAEGRVVLVVNKASGLKVENINDLTRADVKRIAIANPAHAPYGKAAMEAMQKLGVWNDVKAKLVYGENVRQTLQYVQTGDAPIGVVALSVANVPEVTWTPISPALHNPIIQAVGVVKTTRDALLAKAFIGYVNGEKGRAVMKKYGFFMPSKK